MPETLSPGTIYRVDGVPRIYVRTERRGSAPESEHLFIHACGGVVYHHWTTVVPSPADLIVDEGGRREAEEERWLRLVAEHNIEILAGLLRRACGWLPRERAAELRKAYAQAQPPREG